MGITRTCIAGAPGKIQVRTSTTTSKAASDRVLLWLLPLSLRARSDASASGEIPHPLTHGRFLSTINKKRHVHALHLTSIFRFVRKQTTKHTCSPFSEFAYSPRRYRCHHISSNRYLPRTCCSSGGGFRSHPRQRRAMCGKSSEGLC